MKNSTDHFHIDLQGIIKNELNKDEKILWVGKPNPKSTIIASLGMVLFAIPWTCFAIFWIYGAAGFSMPKWDGPQSLFPLFGIPFVLIGLGMLSAPYWIMRSASRSGYMITNSRVIIFTWRLTGAEIRSYTKDQLVSMQKVVKGNGVGDLIFEEKSDGSGRYKKIGFIGIDDVKSVESIIRSQLI